MATIMIKADVSCMARTATTTARKVTSPACVGDQEGILSRKNATLDATKDSQVCAYTAVADTSTTEQTGQPAGETVTGLLQW